MRLKDQILTVVDLKREVVPMPEWGFDVTIQQITAEQANALGAIQMDPTEMTSMQRLQKFGDYLLTESIIDPETGERVFTPADLPALSKKNPQAIARIVSAAMALNGYGVRQEEQALKNSDAGTIAGSPSVSASPSE